MAELPDPGEETIKDPPATAAECVRAQFVAAWDEALRQSKPPPDLDRFLALLDEPERTRLRPELEALEQTYRQRRASGDLPGRPDETLPLPPAADSGTVDVPSAANGARTAEAAAGGTVDYRPDGTAPDQPGDAARTYVPAGRGPAPVQTVAGYEILGTLGRGAMGVVYKARQRGLRRVVALKMILSGGHADVYELGRFRTEAEAIARVQHPGIVQIYEVGEEDGRPFFSLEYVDGGSLQKKIRGEPQPPAEAAQMARRLADAIACAHAHGVVHRDLKPANVLLTRDGQPKITDFGLAKRLEDDSGQTHSGAILGTPSYMAPEQAEGKVREVGALSDVYALGAVLYELLTGRPPFKGASLLDTLEQVRTREPVPPTVLQLKVPGDLETVCLKCLQKDPKKRYPSAGELADDLGRYLRGEPVRARPAGRAERLWRWARRNPKVALLSAGLVLFVVGWAVSATVLKLEADANARLAETNEQRARQNEVVAQEQKKLAEENAGRATKNAEEARANEAKALRNAQASIQRVIRLGEFLQVRLRDPGLTGKAEPEVRALREDLIARLKADMENMAREIERTNVSAFTRAATYQQLGDLLQHIGRSRDALAYFRKAYDAAKRVAQQKPEDDKAQANLAVMVARLGDAALELNGDTDRARAFYGKSLGLHEQLRARPRSHFYPPRQVEVFLSQDLVRLGQLELEAGRPAEARAHFRTCLDLRLAWRQAEPKNVGAYSYLSQAYLLLGTALGHLGDARNAEACLSQALEMTEHLARVNPHDLSFQADRATIGGARGDVQLLLDQPEQARASYRQALAAVQASLARPGEDYAARQALLAQTHERLAAVALRLGRPAEAAGDYKEALALRRQFAEADPGNRTVEAAYLLALAHAGRHAEAARRADALCRQAPGSAPLLLQAARAYAAAADDPGLAGKALQALRAAVAAGYRDVVALQSDPDLARLRQEPGFRALLAELRPH
jgi:serine/threonine-protein kinase